MTGAAEGVPYVSGTYGRFREEPLDAEIAQLAVRQHGVVSLTQLKALGLGADAVRKRARAGRLHRIHRGVYAVGHPRLTGLGRTMAAVLACGPGAVASHASAARVWGLRPDNRAVTDVSVRARSARPRPGIRLHVTTTLTAADVAVREAIPCTAVARTLLDLAEVVDRRRLERALEQAEVLRLFDLRALEGVLDRSNGRRGGQLLRAALAELAEPAITASETEEVFLALCRRAGLPRPDVNTWLVVDSAAPIKADFVWRRERLVVETDAYGTHGSRQAFERDRLRDQRLRLAGWQPLRVTRVQLRREPDRAIGVVATLHGRAARPSSAAAR